MRRNFVRPARALLAAASVLSLLGVVASPAHAAAGDLDSSFGAGGKLTTDFGGYEGASAVAIQSDGKIVVAGYTSGASEDFAVARYNTNGSPDSSFDGDGKLTTDFGGYEGASAVAIQSDGKIVVAGYTSGASDDFAVARYNSNGSLDTGFSGDGKLTTDFGGYEGASAVAIQSDGKIVVAGYTSGASDDFAIARYNSNGSLDTGFSGDGKATTDFGGYEGASAVAIQPDDKIVVAGHTSGASDDFAVARYNTNGSPDSSFDGDGKLTTDFGGYEGASAVAIQSDGKIVVAGYTSAGVEDFAVARYNTNGSLDSGFSGDGKATTDFGGYEGASAVAIQSDGKVVVAGHTSGASDDFAIARYQASGGADANSSPAAAPDAKTTATDRPVDIAVLTNDTDSDGDTLSVTSVSTPAHGTAGLIGGVVRYLPASGFAGTDTFTYTISDGHGGTATGTVTVTVQRPSDGVDIEAAGTVESAPQATPATPVAVAVTSPNAGRVTIADATDTSSPAGYTVLGRRLHIEAPAASATDPLRLTFRIERTVLEAAGGSPSTVTVFRDGAPAGECPGSTTAVPDPCVTSRSIDTNTDDVVVTVLAAHASDWFLGVAGPQGDGYWMLGRDGKVYNFGKAAHLGDPSANRAPGASFVDLEPTPTGDGYWIADDQGRLYSYNAKGFANVTDLGAGEQVTSISSTKDGKGLWIFTNRGRVIVRGEATHYGDMSGVKLNGPVLDSIVAPDGAGYYMVASDGGVFTFGTAHFEGSMGDKHLNAPVQSLVPDPDGSGYWLVASDGGVFAFGAPFRGSMGGTKLNKPMAGMVPYGTGYLMVAEDGGVFDFSPDKDFLGSLGANPPAFPVVSVAIH
ncbi:MAG TPA: Ig-like domain-containing protein [Acidimicrobiia bacterium]|nr:Ig-like domain-containing protein [Acidimicrobiia bacterium]